MPDGQAWLYGCVCRPYSFRIPARILSPKRRRVRVFVDSGGRSIGVVRDLAKVQAWVRVPSAAPFLLESGPYLISMLAYLCGPIEFAADGGKLWRRKLTPFLHNDLGHRVYDPAEDEKKNLTDEEAGHFQGVERNGRRTISPRGPQNHPVRSRYRGEQGRLCHLLLERRWRGAHPPAGPPPN